MVVTIVTIKVKKECLDAFMDATIRNHQNSVREPGCLRFDFLRDGKEPLTFYLYEAYESAEDAAAHKQTEHYNAWRATVETFMAEPRTSHTCSVVAPTMLSQWRYR